jgi:mannitol 2-dehydrogenase
MVDRITPVTSEQDIEDLRSEYQLEDRWPVVCEPFIQWVIEDHFAQGRPDWGKVGVQFVKEVEPYEKMKIRLLNAGHSLLGFSGSLYGFKTIDETVRNPMITAFLRKFMDHEASPVLGKIKGVDLGKYKNNLLQRFANPYIGDQLSRICSESSSKIPKFLLPTIREQLERGGSLECSALIIAAWCRNLELTKSTGDESGIKDTMKEILIEGAKASMDKDPLAFLKLSPVFGNLVRSEEFVETYLRMIGNLRKHGIGKAVKMVVEAP